jgi:hypothetical protein
VVLREFRLKPPQRKAGERYRLEIYRAEGNGSDD